MRVLAASQKFYILFETAPEFVEHISFFEILKGQFNVAELQSLMKNVLAHDLSFEDYQFNGKSGSPANKTLLISANTFQMDENGDPNAIVFIEDITDHLLREFEFKALEETYYNFMEKGNDGIVILQDFMLDYVNTRFSEMLGYSREELADRNILDYVPVEHRLVIAGWINKVLKSGQNIHRNSEINFIMKKGDVFPAEISLSFVHHKSKSSVMMVARNISERKQAESEIKASEEKYSNLVEKGNDGILILQNESIKFVNSVFCEQIGRSRKNLIGSSFLDHVPLEYRRMVSRRLKKVLKDSRSIRRSNEVEFLTIDGKTFPAEISLSFIEHEGISSVMVATRDISERKRAETELKDSERKYSTIVEKGNDGIIIVQDDVLVFVNMKFCEITGYVKKELVGQPFDNFISVEYRNAVLKKFKRSLEKKRDVERKYEVELLSKSGKGTPVEINASVIEHEGEPAYGYYKGYYFSEEQRARAP